MSYNWKSVTSFSTDRPLEVDTTSSNTTVYVRRNIRKVNKLSKEDSSLNLTYWVYDETQMTPEEFKSYYDTTEKYATEVIMKQLHDNELAINNLTISISKLTSMIEDLMKKFS